jgi:hypothetical protein
VVGQLWNRYLAWRRGDNYERNLERFQSHPWRSGISQAPVIGAAAGVAVGVLSWDLGFGVVSGLLVLILWPCYYRAVGSASYRRVAGGTAA